MAKLSGNYEVVYILNPNLDEEATAAMVAKFKTLVEQNGTLAEVDEWGKRHLAYPINDLTEGYYVLMTFSAKPRVPPRAGSYPAHYRRRHALPDRLQGRRVRGGRQRC